MMKTRFLAQASLSDVTENDLESLYRTKAGTDLIGLSKQKDLMGIESILVSTGMNRNDDVFIPEELAPIANTGAHKPMNIEHDEEKIVGHMVESFLTTKGGKIIESLDNLPESFDVTNRAVLYKFIYSALADEVKRRSDSNNLFVSVEMWFSHYDYSLGNKVFEKNEETQKHLESCLRANGGTGKFEDKKVGRVLRNMLIAGIGLVNTPANPESIIRSVGSYHIIGDSSKIFDVNSERDVEYIVQDSPKEDKMDISKITEEVTKLVKASAEKEAEQTGDSQASDSNVNTTENVDVTEAPEAMQKQLEASQKEIERLGKVVQQLELDRRIAVRREQLRSLNLSDQFVESKLQECLEMPDGDFESLVAHAKSIVDELSSESKQDEVENKAEAEDNTESVEDKAEADEGSESLIESEDKTEAEENQVTAKTEDTDDSSTDDNIDLEDVTPIDANLNIEIKEDEDDVVDALAKLFEERLCASNPKLSSVLEK